jgi:crotonobetainyl-CoA:carnitine CoA-transferase CaiB-like acyl-CoA transferase
MFRRTLHPGVGEFLTATTPLDFGATPRVQPGVAPRLGEHTAAVLQAMNAGNDNQATDR